MSSDSQRRIVADTGPIISIERLTDGFGFIAQLYDEVLVPSAVMRELVVGQFDSTAEYLSHFRAAEVLVVRDPESSAPSVLSDLDPGERAAIQLAKELDLNLLIEEEAGRRAARQADLHISGIAGQLLKSVRLNVIPAGEAKKMLEELRTTSRINRKVYEAVLAAIGNEA